MTSTKSREPIAAADVPRIFDDACIDTLAAIGRLRVGADRKRFAEGVREAARIYARDAREPTDNELHAEIHKLYRAAERKRYELIADLLERLSPRARHLLDTRGARPSLGIRLPRAQALRAVAQREEACAKIATLCQYGGGYVEGRRRPSGRRSKQWRVLLHAPEPSRQFPKRDAERGFVMWLQVSWLEATGERPSVAANSARPGPFARMVQQCLKLVGATRRRGGSVAERALFEPQPPLPVRTGFFGARKCSAMNQPWNKDDEIIALLAERWPRCFMLAEDRRLPFAARASRLPNEGSRKPPSKGALAPHYCR